MYITISCLQRRKTHFQNSQYHDHQMLLSLLSLYPEWFLPPPPPPPRHHPLPKAFGGNHSLVTDIQESKKEQHRDYVYIAAMNSASTTQWLAPSISFL